MINYSISLATVVLLFAAMASSFNLLIGFSRLFSIAHAAFVGIGAYALAVGTLEAGLPWAVAALIGVSFGTLFGFLIGALALRVADDYLAIATFAFQFVFTVAITNMRGITGGASGLTGIPAPQIAGFAAESRLSQLVVAAGVLGLTLEVARRLKTSPFGLVLRASGQDDLAAQALGKRTRSAKIAIHALSGGLAALAGVVYAGHIIFIVPAMFDIHFSILLLSMVIIGGAGSLFGPLVGAIVMVAIPDFLSFVGATSTFVANVRQILFGLVLLMVVVVLRRGVIKGVAFRPRLPDDVARERADGQSEPAETASTPSTQGASIDSIGLEKAFGGIRAVDNITTRFAAGQVTGIVGPNGAGKTTLFDLIAGFVTPDAGQVTMNGSPLAAASASERCRNGLVKTFQDLRLFPEMTVLENVMIAVPLGAQEGMLAALVRRRGARRAIDEAAIQAASILKTVAIEDWDREAAELSYAEQKLLNVARALATRPAVILLDEPVSGLDPDTLARMSELVRGFAADGLTVSVVEHNTQALAAMADHMVFLHLGRVLEEGPPAEIMRSEQLASVYFGIEGDGDDRG